MVVRLKRALLLLGALVAVACVSSGPAYAADFGPIRAAFFYPWYPLHWTSCGSSPCTKYSPSLGNYNSTNPGVISSQIQAMLYGHITAGISSWWGQGDPTDTAFSALLQASHGTSFKWTIYYELENYDEPSESQIHNDLLYIQSHYASDPNFLTVDGRMVIFVYTNYSNETCSVVSKWEQANAGINAYLSLSIVPGWQSCPAQPDSWHYYDPLGEREVGTASTGGNSSTGDPSFSISPGFYPYYNPLPACEVADTNYPDLCLPRDSTTWTTNVRDMVASGATWQLITTFNEWNEGTAVEEATGLNGWSSSSGYGTYLDALAADP